ncbi:MAG: hypothetical protein O6761_07845 [Thaumarchaeota archaeon]|nr:hypothetical protein [Nitrososphaerota archaeon]
MKDKIYHGRYGDSSTEFNNEKELEELIQSIMIKDGPDGHCDGADIIAKIIWERIEELRKKE